MRVINLYLYNRRGEKIFRLFKINFYFNKKKAISMPSSISSDGLVLLPNRDMTTLLLKLRVDNERFRKSGKVSSRTDTQI